MVLVTTLAGSAATHYVLYALLRPTSLASEAYRDYLEHNKVLDLPVGFTDRSGTFMADVQYAVEHLERSSALGYVSPESYEDLKKKEVMVA